MKKLAIRVLNKCVRVLSENHSATARLQAQRCVPWYRDHGDTTLRLDYPLTESSVVFDIGGYMGDFASAIHDRFGCRIHVFEPVPAFCEIIRQKFLHNEKVQTFAVGLSNRNGFEEIALTDDGSSIFIKHGEQTRIELKRAVDFLAQHQIRCVDLAKINIEGAEYDLLEDLLESGCITVFKNLQVQFHDFIIENAPARMKGIQDRLSKTHELTYQYPFVWENWRLKSPPV
ncbi:MAG: FkbM family methyltransferase [Caldimonas sp.]